MLRNMFLEMCQDIESIITLIELPAYPQAGSILRSLIDLYFSFSIVAHHPEATDEYFLFLKFANDYDKNREYSKDFNDSYEICNSEKIIRKKDYLNYGWMNSIEEYRNKKHKTFTRSDFGFLIPIDKVNKNDLLRQYIFLSKFIHGCYSLSNYSVKDFPLYIMQRVHTILNDIGEYYEHFSSKKITVNGISLLPIIETNHERIIECRDRIENAK